MPKTYRARLENVTEGPKIVHGLDGDFMAEKGGVTPVIRISQAELDMADRTGWWVIEAEEEAGTQQPSEQQEPATDVVKRSDTDDDAPALSGLKKSELLKIADAEGVDGVTSQNTNDEIRDAIEAHRAGAEGDTGEDGLD